MRKIIRHASLFSGIGAPELAALWLGWQNVFHCEINEFCNTILNYWFPNSINYDNIKTTDFSKWQGQIDILTGGFPCQPFSSAGQRLGADDDRYLWPEMLRVIRQIQPTFVIGENVAGILSMVQPSEEVKVGSTTSLFDENDDIYKKEQQFVVETVCSDLEREGYSVQPFVIPACAVGAPHQRDRVWFVARRNVSTPTIDTLHKGVLRRPCVDESEGKMQRLQERHEIQQSAESSSLLRHTPHTSNAGAEGVPGRQAEVPFPRSAPYTISGGDTAQQAHQGTEEERRNDDGEQSQRRATPQWSDGFHQFSRHAADSECERRDAGYDDDGQPQGSPQEECSTEQLGGADCPQDWWRDFPTVSPICRGNDGLPFDISHLTIPFTRWRQESIKALGNSMVPQVVLELFRAIEAEIFEE